MKPFLFVMIVILLVAGLAHGLLFTPSNITYHPAPSTTVVSNPMMGFAPSATGGPYQEPHTLVYTNVTWRELEPTKGDYRFEELEEKWKKKEWDEKNVQFILRVVMDYPSHESHLDIPDWLYSEINGQGTWYETEWGKGFSPDYNHPRLIQEHAKLIQELGKRYNQDDQVAFIELGSIGHWGEWHTYQDKDLVIPFPTLSITDQYVTPYLTYLNEKLLLMRRPYPLAKESQMGLFNDMFGNHEHTVNGFSEWVEKGYTFWLTGEQHPAMQEFWKVAPSGGEFDPTQEWDELFSEKTLPTLLDQAKDTHISWLGPNVPVGEHSMDKTVAAGIDQFLQTIGYHFVIDEVTIPEWVKADKVLEGTFILNNRGTAPFYRNWPVYIGLVDAKGEMVASEQVEMKLSEMLPGRKAQSFQLKIPSHLAKGTYQLAIAIMNPRTNTPGIKLELKEQTTSGWHLLGGIHVKE